MTRAEILMLKKYFAERNMTIIQVCLLLDIVTVRLENGRPQKYSLKNFRRQSWKQ